MGTVTPDPASCVRRPPSSPATVPDSPGDRPPGPRPLAHLVSLSRHHCAPRDVEQCHAAVQQRRVLRHKHSVSAGPGGRVEAEAAPGHLRGHRRRGLGAPPSGTAGRRLGTPPPALEEAVSAPDTQDVGAAEPTRTGAGPSPHEPHAVPGAQTCSELPPGDPRRVSVGGRGPLRCHRGNRSSQGRSQVSGGGRRGPHHEQTPGLRTLPGKAGVNGQGGALETTGRCGPLPYDGGWRSIDRRRCGPSHRDAHEAAAIWGPSSRRRRRIAAACLRISWHRVYVEKPRTSLKENADHSAAVT